MYFEFIYGLLNEAFEEDIKEIKDKIEIEYKELLRKEIEKLRDNNAKPEEITKAKQENAKEKNLKQKEEVRKFLSTKSKDDLKTTKENKIEISDVVKRKLEKLARSKETTIEKLIENGQKVDFTKDKKYTNTILLWWTSKQYEDLEAQIKPYFEQFEIILKNNPGKNAEISKKVEKNEISFEEFKEDIQKESNQSDSKLDKKLKGFEKIAENDSYACYKIDKWVGCGVEEKGKEKHQAFTGNIDWCVKYKNMFDDYKPPYYMFVDKKNDKEFALYEPKSKQFKDVHDTAITKEDYEKIKDIAEPLIRKFNPDVFEKEKEYSLVELIGFDIIKRMGGDDEIDDVSYVVGIDKDKTFNVDKYKELIDLLVRDERMIYEIEETKKILNKYKDIVVDVINFVIKNFDYMPLWVCSYIPSIFDTSKYDDYDDCIYFAKQGIDVSVAWNEDKIEEQIVKYGRFYIFPYIPKSIQEKIKKEHFKEYECIKFHLDNNPIMEVLPKEVNHELTKAYILNDLEYSDFMNNDRIRGLFLKFKQPASFKILSSDKQYKSHNIFLIYNVLTFDPSKEEVEYLYNNKLSFFKTYDELLNALSDFKDIIFRNNIVVDFIIETIKEWLDKENSSSKCIQLFNKINADTSMQANDYFINKCMKVLKPFFIKALEERPNWRANMSKHGTFLSKFVPKELKESLTHIQANYLLS
jgi:hypothetical protein